MKREAFHFSRQICRSTALGIAILASLFGTLGNANAQDYTKDIATINGESINGSDFVRRMIYLPGVGRLEGSRYIETYPGYLAMQQIINEKLLLQLAAEKKVMPKPAEVTAELEKRLSASPKMMESMKAIGVTKSDLEQSVRVEMAEFNLTTMGVNITDQEVEKHYKSNPTLFTIPKRYKLRGITVPEASKAEVDAALKGGMKFIDAAKKFSIDPAAENGGAMGEISELSLAPPTKVALGKTRIGEATDWITGSTGNFYKFFVEDILPSKLLPLDAELKVQIRRQLMLDRGRVRNNLDLMMIEMRNKAKLSCDLPGIKEILEGWLKSKMPS